MTAIIRWDADLTALSSIAHGGEQLGTISLLRREKVLLPDGQLLLVPVISGNSVRGTLRRIGEELLRAELAYDGQLTLPAAHALRGGGALAKCQGPALTGARLATLRELIPQVGVFGTAAGGTIVDGCLQVGKVLPVVRELVTQIPPRRGEPARYSLYNLVQVENYARQDDLDRHGFMDRCAAPGDDAPADSRQMQFGVETLAAGTRLVSWMQLSWATPMEISFFTEVLQTFAGRGRIGGRIAAGHGQVAVTLHRQVLAGQDHPVQWRTMLAQRHSEALEALTWLT